MPLLVGHREDIPVIYKKIQVRLFIFVILFLLLAACAPVEAPPINEPVQTQIPIQPTQTVEPEPSSGWMAPIAFLRCCLTSI